MRCENCGKDYASNLDRCPYCNASARYSGNTTFYRNVTTQNLRIRDIFSNVFRRHPKGAGARLFIAGTPLSTPSPDRMLAEWQKPWLFMRVFGVGALFCLLCLVMLFALNQVVGLTSLMIGGLFVIPFTFLIFTWEMNIPRDIPFYSIFLAFLIGGGLSLLFSLIFLQFQDPSAPDSWAAFVEEPGKLLAAALFIYLFKVRFGLGGILLGAAVGCGFKIFEDIMYIMNNGNDFYIFFIRTISIGTHYLWAACEGGALALALNGETLSAKTLPKVLTNRYFWIAFVVSVINHFLWNAIGTLLSMIVIPIVQFVLFFYILKPCLKQVVDTVNRAAGTPVPQPKPEYNPSIGSTAVTGLRGVQGSYLGSTIPLQYGLTVKIGRSPEMNQIVLPADAVGVSREHCVLMCDNGSWVIVDTSSTSTLVNQQAIAKNQPVVLNLGDTISIGTPAHIFTIV